MDEKQIVKNINSLRMAKKISLGKLAVLTGLTKSYVSKIVNSKKAPPFSTLIKIANALDVERGRAHAKTSNHMKKEVMFAVKTAIVTGAGVRSGSAIVHAWSKKWTHMTLVDINGMYREKGNPSVSAAK